MVQLAPKRSASFLKHRSGALNWAPQAPVVQVRLWQNNCDPETAACFGFFSLLVHIYPVLAVIDEPSKLKMISIIIMYKGNKTKLL